MSGKKRDWMAEAFELNRKIDEQQETIVQLSDDIRDRTRMLNIMKKGNRIQMGVLIVIFIGTVVGFLINRHSIVKQGEYNSNLIRPYVYPVLQHTFELSECFIFTEYDFVCAGQTPAYNVESYHSYTDTLRFPLTKREMKCDSISIGFFPMNTKKEINRFYVDSVEIDFTSQPPLESQIIERFSKNSLFLHIYVEFYDFNENLYSVKYTFVPRNLREISPVMYRCDWQMTFATEDRLY